MSRAHAKLEIGISAIIALCAGAIVVEASRTPTLFIDPLGGRAVPLWTAGVVILLAILIAIRGSLNLRSVSPEVGSPKSPPGRTMRRPGGMLVLTLAYVVALHWEINFEAATVAFLALAIGHLSNWEKRVTGIGLCIALFAAFGLHYLMTSVLVVDLP